MYHLLQVNKIKTKYYQQEIMTDVFASLNLVTLGMTQEIKDFHKQKLDERAKAEGRPITFQMTVDDIYAVSQGQLIGRPMTGIKK
jgi:glutamate mutase epsilon subunit